MNTPVIGGKPGGAEVDSEKITSCHVVTCGKIGGGPVVGDIAWMGDIEQILAAISPEIVSPKAQFHQHNNIDETLSLMKLVSDLLKEYFV